MGSFSETGTSFPNLCWWLIENVSALAEGIITNKDSFQRPEADLGLYCLLLPVKAFLLMCGWLRERGTPPVSAGYGRLAQNLSMEGVRYSWWWDEEAYWILFRREGV